MKKYILIIIFFSALALSTAVFNSKFQKLDEGKSSDYQKIRMVLTTSGNNMGINTLTAKKFAEMVKKESGGNVIIDVYDNDQLAGGNAIKGVGMLVNGSIDIAVYTSGTFSALNPKMATVTLPWTFDNYKEAREIIDKSGSAYYEKLLAEQGLLYLGSVHNGFRQISNNRNPVSKPEDLKGMKIRILNNEGYKLFFQSFDAVPMYMGRGEMEKFLQQGDIDGHDMSIFQTLTNKSNKREKYVTIWNYAYENYIFVMNTKTFAQLEPETQELLYKKAKEACEWGRDLLERNEQDIKKKLIKNGVIIKELSPEELEPFKQKAQPLINKLKEKYGEEACLAFGIK